MKLENKFPILDGFICNLLAFSIDVDAAGQKRKKKNLFVQQCNKTVKNFYSIV